MTQSIVTIIVACIFTQTSVAAFQAFPVGFHANNIPKRFTRRASAMDDANPVVTKHSDDSGGETGTTETRQWIDEDDLFLDGVFYGGDEAGTSKQTDFLVRRATPADVPSLMRWFDDDKSKLKSYTAEEIETHIHNGELYLASADGDDNKSEGTTILASLIISFPDRDQTLGMLTATAGMPDAIVEKVPPRHLFVSGLKMEPGFSERRGKLGGKSCLSVGASFFSEVGRTVVRRFLTSSGSVDFAMSCGTSMESLSTLHLATLGRDLIFRAPDLHCLETIVSECSVPGRSTEQALFTLFLCKFVPAAAEVLDKNKSPERSVEDTQITDNEKDFLRRMDAALGNGIAKRYVPPVTMVHGRRRRGLVDICPHSIEELEAIVKQNAPSKIPIGIVSTGKRWGATNKSDNVPTLRLNLSNLRRIPMIDLANGIVVVETGVTQGDVAEALSGSGWYLPITGSCAHSSIIGNAVDGGITSAGLRIDQVIGVQSISPTGEKSKTGVLASRWHGHGYHLRNGEAPSNFMFGKKGIVTKMALRLLKLPRYIVAGIIPGTNDAIATASRLYREGDLAWWQLRVEPLIGPVVVVKHHGSSEMLARVGVQRFFEQLGSQGQVICGCTDPDAAEPSVEGVPIFPEEFVKAGFDYFRGVPQCHRHESALGIKSCSETPQGGNGFRAKAHAVPSNPSILVMLKDAVMRAASQDDQVEATVTCTPMNLQSMYFLVWATFDRSKVGVEERFLAEVDGIMKSAQCPPCRYE